MTERSLRSLYRVIGRETELRAIEIALATPSHQQVLYFEGQGGVGKTRLLAEARARAQQHPRTLVTNVLDLYLTTHHQPIGMMNAIAQYLTASFYAQGEHYNPFANYERAQQQFLASRRDSTDIDSTRGTLVDTIFLEDYARLAEHYSIVLLIDTFEKLNPEIGELEAFNFRENSRLESWLVSLIAALPNTLTLLAGRSRPRQRELLAHTFGEHLTIFAVNPFTLEETTAYIAESLMEDSDDPATIETLSPETIESLHRASGGRPVVLAIALACAQIRAFDLAALPADFEEQYPENRERLSDEFVNLIVRDLQESRPEIADLLTKAVYLRKGLRLPLLQQIARAESQEPELAELATHLSAFSQLSFVKAMGEQQIILHDEMYELLFGKLDERQSKHWYKAAIDWLDEQLEQSEAEEPGVYNIQMLQVERLFYQMSLAPRRGYEDYRRLSISAIQSRDEDFDTQLQDEIARFYDEYTAWGRFYRRLLTLSGLHWRQIVYDEGVRWVYRRIASPLHGASRYSLAIDIANQVRAKFPDIYQDNTLARCDLEVAQLQAEVYITELTPRGADIVQNYTAIVEELEVMHQQMQAASATDDTYLPDLHHVKFILANAYNYWGYFDRINERLQSAIDKYKHAIRLFKELGSEVDSLRATTLNNLGFALSRQGDSRRGLEFVQRALPITILQGASYRTATTLNTMAHVQMDLNEVEAALENVTRARQMFEEMDSMRGLALCAMAEGRVRNRVASLWQDAQEQDREYHRASECYQSAMELFDTQVEGELSRRIESRLYRSTVFRNWGTARYRRDEDGSEQMQTALELLNAAQALCTPATPRMIVASILESKAVVYINQQHYSEGRALLDQARAVIPEEYDIQPGFGVTNTPKTQELRIYWLRLGQLELQYAFCDFGEGDYHAGTVHLLRAFAALTTFWPQTSLLITFRLLAKRELMKITDPALMSELRRHMRASAQELRIERSTSAILEEVFEEVIEDLSLF